MSDPGYILYCLEYKAPSEAERCIEEHIRTCGGSWLKKGKRKLGTYHSPLTPEQERELDRKLAEIERAFFPNGVKRRSKNGRKI